MNYPSQAGGRNETGRFDLYRNIRASGRGAYEFSGTLSTAGAMRAFNEIREWHAYAPTPLRELSGMAARAGVLRVLYKDEASRFGLGSFKALGGAYAVAQLLQQLLSRQLNRAVSASEIAASEHASRIGAATVACASDGNHGRSVAAGARRFGCACTIFLHEGVSLPRERAITDLGATVIRVPGTYDDSVVAAVRISRARGWHVVADTSDDPADHAPIDVMHGYCTLLIETLQQLRNLSAPVPTHVFIQGGVGGLAAAVAAFLWETLGPKEAPIFVVVEPARADCLYQSARSGRPTRAQGDLNTLMAGLSCGEVSRVAWPILQAGVEFFMTVHDESAVECMRLLRNGALGGGSIIAGESGVAGLAGLLVAARDPSGEALRKLQLDSSSTVLIIGTEGATDPEIYERLTTA